MKEYKKDMRYLKWPLVIWGAVGTLSLYFEEWFPWSAGLYFGLCLFLIPLLVISPLKYFCGIVSLRVSQEKVQRVWMRLTTCTISRENAIAFTRSVLGIYCMVFSSCDLRHARTAEIIHAAFKRKAIIFPYIIHVKKDFPEWFV